MSRGDIENAKLSFVTLREFKEVFAGPNVDAFHGQVQQAFLESLEANKDSLQGVEFIEMDMHFCPEPIPVKKGMRIGSMTAKQDTFITDNIGVFVTINGEKRSLKLDSMVKVGDRWLLMSPISFRKQW